MATRSEDDDKALSQYDMWYLLRRFGREYLKPNLGTYLPVQSLHVIGSLVGLIPPILLRRLIDQTIPSQNVVAIVNISLLALGTFAVSAGIRFLRNYWGHKIAQRIVYDMRNDIYDHFQRLPMRFHDDKKTGELMSRVVDDLNTLQEFIHHGPEGFLVGLTTIVGVLAVLFTLNVPLTLIALSFTPFLGIFAYSLVKRMHKAFRRNRRAKAKLHDRLEDNLAGMKVIKSFANEDFEFERFTEENKAHYDARASAIKYFSTLGPVSYFLNSIGLILTLGYGGYLVSQNLLTAGTIVAFYTYLLRFRAPILRIVRISQRLSRFFASMERYFSYLDLKPDISATSGSYSKPKEEIRGEVELNRVHFSYRGEDTVLTDIDIHVPPQTSVAFVGPSGAGKTTVVRLLPRFYDIDRGSIKIDGVPISEWEVSALRNSISMVMQDDYLFSGTIAENISYGKPGAPMEEIKKYAAESNVDEFVNEMPDGYQTEVGQRGVKLSGGQRQRISIARALLQDPKILILDEATSSVDSYTEKLIQEAIERVTAGRTTFIIAHRLSTIIDADEILFIEDGQILEQGDFDELMDQQGRFYHYYELQFEQPTKQS